MGDLVESMKRAALDAVRSANPTAILFGEVVGVNPLQISVEQRMVLDESFLVIPQRMTDHDMSVSVQWHTGSALGTHQHAIHQQATESSGDPAHVHQINGTTVSANLNHGHTIEGIKTMRVHAGLRMGEKVLLIRQEGGQKYIVLDRMG